MKNYVKKALTLLLVFVLSFQAIYPSLAKDVPVTKESTTEIQQTTEKQTEKETEKEAESTT